MNSRSLLPFLGLNKLENKFLNLHTVSGLIRPGATAQGRGGVPHIVARQPRRPRPGGPVHWECVPWPVTWHARAGRARGAVTACGPLTRRCGGTLAGGPVAASSSKVLPASTSGTLGWRRARRRGQERTREVGRWQGRRKAATRWRSEAAVESGSRWE
jgi:hypothetical protein